MSGFQVRNPDLSDVRMIPNRSELVGTEDLNISLQTVNTSQVDMGVELGP